MFKSAITIMLPIFFASLGGLFPVLAGTLNIALEGMLLFGAFSSLAVFYFTGSAFAAILCAISGAAALSLLHIFASFKLKANLFISGLAVNLFSSGLCILLSDKIFNTKGVIKADNISREMPNLLPLYIILGIVLLVLSFLAIYKTPFGFRLRACEKSADSLISLKIKPQVYQAAAILISAIFCGIGGSFLALNLGAYVPNMSAGRGWIALAVIFLGARNPFGIIAASFVFALAESFSNYAQGFWNIPPDFILAIPYVCTLIAIIVVAVVRKRG